jgi:fatty-acid peroxygenase
MSLSIAPATPLPRDEPFDSTLAMLREGYRFIPDRCRRYGTDAFECRLMLHPAVCVSGPDAARMFYHPGRFTRRGALPPTTLKLLQDQGSVATLDGAAHRHRKAMFLSALAPDAVRRLADRVAERWRAELPAWAGAGEVVLHHAVEGILCRAVCDWAGVPLTEAEAVERTREFAAMIDGAGAVGVRTVSGLFRRDRTERWASALVKRARAGEVPIPEGTAAHAVVWHRGADGRLLSPTVAAVELINVLRPTVAVARYVTFAALALHEYPDCREKLRSGDEYLGWFAQEVRRFYPFFPAVGGRVLEPFEWNGRRFGRGAWVLFDVYGTDRDPRAWGEPDAFRPERFAGWRGGPFALVPQGGGDHATEHRCAGEQATVEILKAAVRVLVRDVRYDVPDQDLSVDLSRMPAIPASRFVIANVRGHS